MRISKAAPSVGFLLVCGLLQTHQPTQAADIALDIGHHIVKPGVISERGVTEFDLNRKLALDIAKSLEEAYVSVNVINTDGTIERLPQRTALAATDRLFVSIHHDSVKQRYRPVSHPRFQGYSLWVSEDKADYKRSVQCARTIADAMLAAKFRPSHYHSDRIYGENRPIIDMERGIFSNRHLAVLKTARTPAVLVEAGVVANPDEEVRLAEPLVHTALVQAISDGLRGCLANLPTAN